MTTTTINSLAEIKDLRHDWNRLALAHQNPLLEFDWFECAAKCLHADDEPQVLVVSNRSGTPTAIAPLVLTNNGGSNWIQLIGSRQLYEPSGLIFDDTASLKTLLADIADLRFPVLLSRMDQQFMRRGPLAPPLVASGAWLTRPAAGSPVLDLDSDWDNFLQSMSSKRRYDYRRAKKRALQMGTVNFEVICPNRNDVDHVLTTALDVEDRSWKGSKGSSVTRNSNMYCFISKLCRRMADRGSLRVFFEYVGERPAAMALCIEDHGALWFIKIGYDEEFKSCSPGMLLLMEIVRHCCENDISRIEHLGTMDQWLTPWTSFVRPYSTLIHYPANIGGASSFVSSVSRVLVGKFWARTGKQRTVL